MHATTLPLPQVIDIFDVRAGYKKVVRCKGHSSTITHLDWARDSSVLQSNDQAYEVWGAGCTAQGGHVG